MLVFRGITKCYAMLRDTEMYQQKYKVDAKIARNKEIKKITVWIVSLSNGLLRELACPVLFTLCHCSDCGIQINKLTAK